MVVRGLDLIALSVLSEDKSLHQEDKIHFL